MLHHLFVRRPNVVCFNQKLLYDYLFHFPNTAQCDLELINFQFLTFQPNVSAAWK